MPWQPHCSTRAALLAAALLGSGCETMGERTSAAGDEFGRRADGTVARSYWLRNANGLRARFTDHGATLVEMWLPDRSGGSADCVLGFEDVAGYQSDDNQYFGCTTGRVCNRIRDGRFVLDGKIYQLARNNGDNHLHGGGPRALTNVAWTCERTTGREGAPALRFRYTSPDGEEGYPGNLSIAVTFTLTATDELWIEYEATTDAPTPVNLTNHAYWNLAGHGAETVLGHELTLFASRYTPTDEELIPLGTVDEVTGALDFRSPKPLRKDILPLITSPSLGYDHNFAIDGWDGSLRRAARVREPETGRVMEILTTEPGIQLYSGNFLHGQIGKGNRVYDQRSAMCLETQHYPDAVNQPTFPSIILQPGETFRSVTVHRFSVE